MLGWTWRRAVVVSMLCLMLAAFITIGSGKSDDGQDSPEFPQPRVRRSSHGILLTTLQAFIAHSRIQDPTTGDTHDIVAPAYNGMLPGPTIRVNPGDNMNVLLVNNFPPNPEQDRMGAFPHLPYTTNLHTHGLTVSPIGHSDNVFREMDPGTRNWIRVKIPTDHQSGTFWYHPHKHGSVAFQFFGGMAGFLIVEGRPGTLD
jgi:FtsP/CotA-like multicopper oxidase with cupredoxin domain